MIAWKSEKVSEETEPRALAPFSGPKLTAGFARRLRTLPLRCWLTRKRATEGPLRILTPCAIFNPPDRHCEVIVLRSSTSNHCEMLAFCAVGRIICRSGGFAMPRGDKSAYTDKQKRQAEHIEEGYEQRGVSEDEAERRAWATVNKETGGGKKSGSGRGKPENHAPSRKGGKLGGKAAASRPASARSASAKKAAATRKRKSAPG
jgi:plasmid stabilization system protein ParE